jgi:hypothetical protein
MGHRGWPLAFRGIGATPRVHLQMEQNLKPIDENGFVIADFTPDGITIRVIRFNHHRQRPPTRSTRLNRFASPN